MVDTRWLTVHSRPKNDPVPCRDCKGIFIRRDMIEIEHVCRGTLTVEYVCEGCFFHGEV